jgi:predicted CopG family antitoxin
MRKLKAIKVKADVYKKLEELREKKGARFVSDVILDLLIAQGEISPSEIVESKSGEDKEVEKKEAETIQEIGGEMRRGDELEPLPHEATHKDTVETIKDELKELDDELEKLGKE